MYVLDTNVVSELRKVRKRRADPGVARWSEATPSAEMFVSAITIHELELGVLLRERSDPDQGAVLRQWLDNSVAMAFDQRVLPVAEDVARRAAALHVPDPASYRDALIGGSALAHGMTVVTRNVTDFEGLGGLEVLNPWQ